MMPLCPKMLTYGRETTIGCVPLTGRFCSGNVSAKRIVLEPFIRVDDRLNDYGGWINSQYTSAFPSDGLQILAACDDSPRQRNDPFASVFSGNGIVSRCPFAAVHGVPVDVGLPVAFAHGKSSSQHHS